MSEKLFIFSTIFCYFLAKFSFGYQPDDFATESYQVDERAGYLMKEFSCLQPSKSGSSSRRWLKNSILLTVQPDDWIVTDRDTMEQQPRVEITEDALLFRALRLEDSGVYDCVASDQVVLSRYRLLVRDVPNPPGTPTALLVSPRNISLIW